MSKTKLSEKRKELSEELVTEALKEISTLNNKNKISDFKQIFEYVPRSQFADLLGVNRAAFLHYKSKEGSLWRLGNIWRFSELTGASPDRVFQLLFKYKG